MVKVSIIVPVYNVEKYLAKCLDSLVSQSLKEIEIVLVNDGSTDNSKKIIKSYQKKYPNLIQSIEIPNGGVGNARNVGLKKAKGEYIGFVDSDDYVDQDMYLKMYQQAKKNHSDVVTCGYYTVTGNILKEKRTEKVDGFDESVVENPDIIVKSTVFCWAHIYKRDFLFKNHIEFTSHKVFEDLLFVYKTYRWANKISKVFEPLYFYVTRDDGTSLTQGFSKKYFAFFDVASLLIEYYGDAIPKEYLTYIFLKHIFARFNTKVTWKELPIKKEFVDESFSLLNSFDSQWHHNFYFKNTHFYYYWKSYWLLKPQIHGKRK